VAVYKKGNGSSPRVSARRGTARINLNYKLILLLPRPKDSLKKEKGGPFKTKGGDVPPRRTKRVPKITKTAIGKGGLPGLQSSKGSREEHPSG